MVKQLGHSHTQRGCLRKVFLDSWRTLVVQAFSVVETLVFPERFLSASGDQNSTLDAWHVFKMTYPASRRFHVGCWQMLVNSPLIRPYFLGGGGGIGGPLRFP